MKSLLEDWMGAGSYVVSLQIGKTTNEDVENTFFKDANKQVDMACKAIKEDEKLKNG